MKIYIVRLAIYRCGTNDSNGVAKLIIQKYI